MLLESAAQLEGLNDDGDHFRDLTKLQLRNYGQLYDDELRWIKKINYSSVMRAIADGVIGAVPDDLHRRFDRVREVHVDAKVEDEQHLIDFLRKFDRLEKVSVSKAALGAAFYERLAVEFPRIRALFLHEADGHFQSLNFVFKFSNLTKLKAKGLTIERDFVQKLFDTYPVFELAFANNSRYREDYETFRRAHPKCDSSTCRTSRATFTTSSSWSSTTLATAMKVSGRRARKANQTSFFLSFQQSIVK